MDRGNARIIAGAIASLAAPTNGRILEIGFGGGLGLELLLKDVPQGSVAGTELSDVMLSRAAKRFAPAIKDNHLELVSSAVEKLPFEDASFDGVVTINTVYFWHDPKQGLAEILRVLRPSGRLVLGIRPAASMRRLPFTRHGFTIYEPEHLEEMLKKAGFIDMRATAHDDDSLGYVCLVAHKPG